MRSTPHYTLQAIMPSAVRLTILRTSLQAVMCQAALSLMGNPTTTATKWPLSFKAISCLLKAARTLSQPTSVSPLRVSRSDQLMCALTAFVKLQGNDADSVDNYIALWTGQDAYNGYNAGNAAFIGIRQNGNSYTGGSYTTTLTAGQLLPVTLLYINGGGIGNFEFSVITPDGINHFDTTGFWVSACSSSPFNAVVNIP